MNQNLFTRMEEAFSFQTANQLAAENGVRWISFGESNEIKNLERTYLGSIKVISFSQNPFVNWAKIEVDGIQKIIFNGPNLNIDTSYDLRLVKPAEFLFFSDFFKTYPIKNHLSIMEILRAGSTLTVGYVGHDFALLSNIFAPVYCYEQPDVMETCVSCILRRICASLDLNIQTNYKDIILPYMRESDWLECRFEQAKLSSLFNLGNPLQFMHFYWIIESFYFEYSIKDLFQESKSTVSEQEFYKLIEDGLDWRPKEITALSNTVKKTISKNEIERICHDICKFETSALPEEANQIDFLAKKLYKFRNKIVHARHADGRPTSAEIKHYSHVCVGIVDHIIRSRAGKQSAYCLCGTIKLEDSELIASKKTNAEIIVSEMVLPKAVPDSSTL